jgi:hypothetical protein
MNLHKRNEFQRAQWDVYKARQNASLMDRVMASPVTFGICVAVLCALPVVVLLLRY